MSHTIPITLPNIGDFKEVEVIELLIQPGQLVEKETSILTLESEKATMEVPSPAQGIVERIHVKTGDRVSEGTLLVELRTMQEGEEKIAPQVSASISSQRQLSCEDDNISTIDKRECYSVDIQTQVVVLGAGPGGYTAAFRAADLGKQVVLIERYATLGGVCLNVGCIPSKTLLHVAEVITQAKEVSQHGILLEAPQINLDRLRRWKASVIQKLTQGLAMLTKKRNIQVVQGRGYFLDANHLAVITKEGEKKIIGFEHAIVAAGSRPVMLPSLPEDPRIMDSTDALALQEIPESLMIVGGGIIGLEMATIYAALGTKRIDIVQRSEQLMPGCDLDLVKPLQRRLTKQGFKIHLKAQINQIEAKADGLWIALDGEGMKDDAAKTPQHYDRMLVAIGRRPNGDQIQAQAAGLSVDAKGFIPVDAQQRTNVENIFAIGDIVGQPMLAHKATHEGKVAAEVIAGHKSAFEAMVIPSVAYTDPEVAWVGATESELQSKGIAYEKGVFPWAASGRSLSLGRDEGLTKLLFSKENHRLLGAGIVGPHAGDLIAEAVLAIEMGCDAHDIGLTIHPHPTLSETLGLAAEIVAGNITDLYFPKSG